MSGFGPIIQTGGGPPSGPAGGVLAQTYPNPGFSGMGDNEFAVLIEIPGNNPVWSRLTQDMILPAYTVTLSGGMFVQVNQPVDLPAFTATYTRTPASAVLTDSVGNPPQDVTSTPDSFSSVNDYGEPTYGASVTFTLTANETSGPSKTATTTFEWVQNVYYGVSNSGTFDASFITGLPTSVVTNTRNRTINVDPTGSEYIYYGLRSAYGTPTFTVGGFAGGFSLVASSVSVTNTYGFSEPYDLWQSNNPGLGSVQVVIT